MWILFDRSTEAKHDFGGYCASCGFQDPASSCSLDRILCSVEEPEEELPLAQEDITLS